MSGITIDQVRAKVLSGCRIGFSEAKLLYDDAMTVDLIYLGDFVRRQKHPSDIVTWQIDRNVNITNVCVSGCKFCSFHCKLHQTDRSYITTIDQYKEKIETMFSMGGDQLLLQGGMHPRLGLEYYEDLFGSLKSLYPTLKLHALGAPEVAYLADKAGLSDQETLERLISAGLSSLPGAGAEILDNDIRRQLSPLKCSADRWLSVMSDAHKLGLLTTATMMYNHIESSDNRLEHLFKLRNLQDSKPIGSIGFSSFIAWGFQSGGTVLGSEGVQGVNNMNDYARLIAISRIVLDNIDNIQASWLSMGVDSAQLALHSGANDMGSIMIEENVVSGSSDNATTVNISSMESMIMGAGFTPVRRNQAYELL